MWSISLWPGVAENDPRPKGILLFIDPLASKYVVPGHHQKKNVTVRWAKFLYGKVGKGIILKIIMPSKLGGGLKHFLFSSPFGGNDPTWLIFFQVGWNHYTGITRKGRGHFNAFFFGFFSVIFQGHVTVEWKARYSSSVLMVSLPESNAFSFWKLMVWVRWNSLKLGEGGPKHGPIGPEGFRCGRCQGS